MRKMTLTSATLACLLAFGLPACSLAPDEQEVFGIFPIDDLEGLITRDGVAIDRAVSSDGRGSLRVVAERPVTVRLYETGDIHLDNSRLTYQARLRTENVDGQVYLEMWCSFPGKGEFFSRGLDAPLSGTTDWVTRQTPFSLKKGENPDNVILNLVINGRGRVWIDDIRLLMAPPGS